MGGATANYNPHLLAFPQADWLTHSEKFLDELELKLTKVSTQIEPMITWPKYSIILCE